MLHFASLRCDCNYNCNKCYRFCSGTEIKVKIIFMEPFGEIVEHCSPSLRRTRTLEVAYTQPLNKDASKMLFMREIELTESSPCGKLVIGLSNSAEKTLLIF